MFTSGDVMIASASCLNDSKMSLFNYTVQLPYLRMAMRDLEHELTVHGVQLTLSVATQIPVLTGADELNLPPSFFLPIKLWERPLGSTTENWTLMKEQSIVEDKETVVKLDILKYWDYKHNCINFNPCTTDREVKLEYWRSLAAINNQSTTVLISGGINALAFRTAELCARFIGGAMASERANALHQEWLDARDLLIDLYVKNNQGNRSRRKRFIARRSSGLGSSITGNS